MKTTRIFLLLFLAFSSSFLSAQDAEAPIPLEKTIATIHIEGMECQEGCADAIAQKLTQTAGVNAAKVSYKSGEAIIDFDEYLITIDQLSDIITNTKVKDYVYKVKKATVTNKILE